MPFTSDLPSQGLNPGRLHSRQILYHLSHQGSPQFAFSGAIFTESYFQEDPGPSFKKCS